MTLRVKEGREYVLGGRMYKSGEIVEGVQPKFQRILTMPNGPLEIAPETKPRRKSPTDLPSDEDVAAEEMRGLRDRYEQVVGKKPFMGWDADELRSRMSTYHRRDMRAEGE